MFKCLGVSKLTCLFRQSFLAGPVKIFNMSHYFSLFTSIMYFWMSMSLNKSSHLFNQLFLTNFIEVLNPSCSALFFSEAELNETSMLICYFTSVLKKKDLKVCILNLNVKYLEYRMK